MYYAEYAKFTYHSSTFLNKHFLISKVHFSCYLKNHQLLKELRKRHHNMYMYIFIIISVLVDIPLHYY
jgi:hypothetical protein